MWTYFFIKWLFKSLDSRLRGFHIGEIFSQNKDEIVFGFYKEGNEDFYWVLNLEPIFPHMRFFSEYKRARRNSVNLFPEIIDSKIDAMKMHPLERSFHFNLSNGNKLIFKLHGGRSNVILQNGEIELFRSQLEVDAQFQIPENYSEEIDWNKLMEKDPKRLFPFIDKRSWKEIEFNAFENFHIEQKISTIKALLAKLEKSNAYLFQDNEKWHLHKIPPKSHFEEFTDPFDACNKYASVAGKDLFLHTEKKQIVKNFSSQISKTEKAIEKMQQRKKVLKESNEWEEKANLIMANLHVFQNGIIEAEIFDFYQQKNRIIKIKQGQSPQKFAENLYKKTKNKQIEIDNLQQSISNKNSLLASLNDKLQRLEQIEGSKELKTWMKQEGIGQKKGQDADESPFKTIQVDTYEVLIGRNAKNNDLLTTRFARKDDIWLHAKDVSGSHVVIRRKAKEKIPANVLEIAASAAAWYSKGKNDTLFPVIYTERKNVRKGKGLAAGQVLLDKHDVLIVKPGLPEN